MSAENSRRVIWERSYKLTFLLKIIDDIRSQVYTSQNLRKTKILLTFYFSGTHVDKISLSLSISR